MYFRELWKKLQQNHSIDPVYLLYGTETGFMHKITTAIQKQVVKEEEIEFLYSKFDYEETPIQSVLLEAETIPLFGERRLIIVDRFSAVTAQKQSSQIEHNLDGMMKYLENPSPYTVLICLTHAEKLDERKKLSKKFHAHAVVCECQPLKADDCKAWVLEYCRNENVNIRSEAVETLIQLAGTDLTILENELEKMILYVGVRGIIDTSVVFSLVSKTAEQNVFVFIDHIVRQRLGQAISALHDLILQKEAPIYLLFMIVRQYRIMLQTMIQAERGYSQQQIASQLGVHPYSIKIAAEQSKHYRKEQVNKILSILAELDYRIKTGKENDRFALERFLLTMPQVMNGELV